MLDTGPNARTTAKLGLPVGWLWVFLKDHSNKLKVGETSQLLFLAFSSGVTSQNTFLSFAAEVQP